MERTEPPVHARRGPWRDLFAFGAGPTTRVELWVGAGAFGVVLLAWVAVTGLGWVQPQFLPSPQAVLAAWVGLFASAGYLGDIGISVARVWVALPRLGRHGDPARHPDEQLPRGRRLRSSPWSISSATCRCRRWCR